jgi:AraC-like DNA-binding protein
LSGPESFAPDVAQRVRQVLGVLFADGVGSPEIRVVADRMGTSVRTLQRRLRARGLTYAGVVQQARCLAARRMLEDRRRRIGEIARALGYSDHAHSTRAFQRWTGLAPREFRRR